MNMNKQRANEIIASPEMIKVTYQDEPIYIQHVDETSDTARIHTLEQPNNEKLVPLDNLTEQ